MGIDISQWRAVIGSNKFRDVKTNRSFEKWLAAEENDAQDLIGHEVQGIWKTAIVLVSLLVASWFLVVHSLPGEGNLEIKGTSKMHSRVTLVVIGSVNISCVEKHIFLSAISLFSSGFGPSKNPVNTVQFCKASFSVGRNRNESWTNQPGNINLAEKLG